MSKLLTEEECGLQFGKSVQMIRSALRFSDRGEASSWISITGGKCSPVMLKFDRAGHNHLDGFYSYCFKSPAGEEIWIDFLDNLSREKRLELLRNIFVW